MRSLPTTFTVTEPESTADLLTAAASSEVPAEGDAAAADPRAPVADPRAADAFVTVVAVIVAEPGLIPVTTPFCETLAIFGADDVHTRAGSAPPPAPE